MNDGSWLPAGLASCSVADSRSPPEAEAYGEGTLRRLADMASDEALAQATEASDQIK